MSGPRLSNEAGAGFEKKLGFELRACDANMWPLGDAVHTPSPLLWPLEALLPPAADSLPPPPHTMLPLLPEGGVR